MRNALFLLGCFLISSCSLDSENTCKGTTVVYASGVEGPKTIRVNEDTKYTVYFQAENSCGKFDTFIVASQGDTVKVAPQVSYDGCVCTQAAVPLQADYTFKATQPGKYYLKFLNGTTSFIVDTVTVQ